MKTTNDKDLEQGHAWAMRKFQMMKLVAVVVVAASPFVTFEHLRGELPLDPVFEQGPSSTKRRPTQHRATNREIREETGARRSSQLRKRLESDPAAPSILEDMRRELRARHEAVETRLKNLKQQGDSGNSEDSTDVTIEEAMQDALNIAAEMLDGGIPSDRDAQPESDSEIGTAKDSVRDDAETDSESDESHEPIDEAKVSSIPSSSSVNRRAESLARLADGEVTSDNSMSVRSLIDRGLGGLLSDSSFGQTLRWRVKMGIWGGLFLIATVCSVARKIVER